MLRIAEIRRQKGVTQEKLAAAIGLSQSNISELENGKHNPQLDTLLKIAKALDCEPYELFREYKRSEIMDRIERSAAVLDDRDQDTLVRFAESLAERHSR